MVGRDVPGAPRTRGRQRRRRRDAGRRGRRPLPGIHGNTRVPHDADHVIMVGRDVHGAPRTRGRQRRRQRGRGPPGTSAPTRVHGNTRVPHDADHVIMVGRDVPGATRTWGRHRDAGRRERRPLPGIHGNTRCRMMMLCVIIGICSFSLESNRVPQNRICPRPHPIGSSAFSHHFILNAKLHGILALPPSSRL